MRPLSHSQDYGECTIQWDPGQGQPAHHCGWNCSRHRSWQDDHDGTGAEDGEPYELDADDNRQVRRTWLGTPDEPKHVA